MFKKILLSFIFVLLVSCSKSKIENKLIIGVSPMPHQELVELVREDLKNEGIDLEVVVFNDYVQPNLSLKDGSLDANFFQHIPYMNNFAKENNFEMSSVGAIHLEPLKAYSKKITNLNELNNNSEILIPNDPTNRGRALLLLESAGLIKLKKLEKLDYSVEDISENLKNLKIISISTDQIAPRLSEVELGIINTNIALAANLKKEDAIIVEGKDSPYVNVISVLKGNENNEKVLKLVKFLQSEKVRSYINSKYNGEVEAAF